MRACESAGVKPEYHFVKTNKMVVIGSGGKAERVDYYRKVENAFIRAVWWRSDDTLISAHG